MRRSSHRFSSLFLSLALLYSASGCSVIGYTLGSVVDQGAASGDPPTASALAKARGREVRVLKSDGRVLRGRLARVDASAESLLVFAAAPPAGGAFLSEPQPDSLRVPVKDVRMVVCPGTTGRALFGGFGLAADIFMLFVAHWAPLTVTGS